MSLEENRYTSPYEEMKREREFVNILLPRDTPKEEESPGHCPAHSARYIDYGNNDLRCPVCGYKKPEVKVEEKPKEPIGKKTKPKNKRLFAISKTRDNKNNKSKGQIEIEKEIGAEISSYEEYDV